MNQLDLTQHRRNLFQGALLVLLVWVVYFPSVWGDFLWDDNDNVTNNMMLRYPNGLFRIWFEPGATQQYYPLTHTSFWLDYQLWGLHPAGYHVVNILCQSLSAILLWQILRRLQVAGAWLGAALFAIHPVGVESVAWITERKNTLSAVFFLAALSMSFKFWLPGEPREPRNQTNRNPRFGPGKFYWLTFVLYVAALLSKTATIGLPAVIFLLVWWRRRKIEWKDVGLLVPFAVAGVGLGLITAWLEKNSGGATGKEWEMSLAQQLVLAGRVCWFYPSKLLWPHPLMFMYPRWVLQTSPLSFAPLLALVLIIALLWQKRNGWARPILFTAGYFLVMIFPVIGFFKVYFYRYSFVCDHFQYLASIAPLALAAAGLTLASARLPNPVKYSAQGFLLLVLGILSFRQIAIYRDRETLWRDSLAHNPNSWIACNNLAQELAVMGRAAEALPFYQRALEIKPDSEVTLYNLGIESAHAGNLDEAISYYRRALRIKPDLADALVNLGNALDAKGDFAGAAQQYTQAAQADPFSFSAFFNLGNELIRMGKFNEAAEPYRSALRIEPESADAHKNLGIALASVGRLGEAFPHFRQSVEINPNNPEIHYCLGRLMMQAGKEDEARAEFTETLRLNPTHAQARQDLEALDTKAKSAPAGK